MKKLTQPRRAAAIIGAILCVSALTVVVPGEAQPPGPATFCAAYPEAPACAAGDVSCGTCHESPPSLNVYGVDLSKSLAVGQSRPLPADVFEAELGSALLAVEDLDSDGDGYDNIAEIESGSSPSESSSVPAPASCADEDEDGWELCGYDVSYAYKKVMIDFCGRSPTYSERSAFASADSPEALLHSTLDACLDSEHWRGIGGRVWSLANRKIGPLQAIKSGKGGGPIPLADYEDDYAYFVWTQTDDRDVRLVLTGKSYVSADYEDGKTVYTEWARSPEEDLELRGYDRYQAVDKAHRAGLLTHRWFLMSNTMFTAIPRTTAAQAYRAFLGYDISKLEGLYPVEGEPADYDSKGVAAVGCANCHSTLDPLSYPFSRYEGIGGGAENAPPYSYNPNRMPGFAATNGERVAETPEAGMLFGQPVANVVQWGEVAANSDAFVRATVLDYWKMLLGEPPRAIEQAEFAALVSDLRSEHAYQIEPMLHDLIDTEAYGAP